MTRIVAALAALLLSLQPMAAVAEDLVVGLIEAAGFCSRQSDGTLTGFNVETARLLCRRMGMPCRMELMPLKDLAEAVGSGQVQIGFGNMLRTPERERVLLFSHPYWRSSSVFVGPIGLTGLKVPDQLDGKRLAVQRGSRQHAWAKERADRLQVVEVAQAADVMNALAAGEADIGLLPMLVALSYLKSGPGQAYDFIGAPMEDNGLGGTVHVVVSRARPDLLLALDKALDASVRDGSLHALSRRFLPLDIY